MTSAIVEKMIFLWTTNHHLFLKITVAKKIKWKVKSWIL